MIDISLNLLLLKLNNTIYLCAKLIVLNDTYINALSVCELLEKMLDAIDSENELSWL